MHEIQLFLIVLGAGLVLYQIILATIGYAAVRSGRGTRFTLLPGALAVIIFLFAVLL